MQQLSVKFGDDDDNNAARITKKVDFWNVIGDVIGTYCENRRRIDIEVLDDAALEFYPDRLRFDSVTKLLRLADHSLVPRVSELANDRSELQDKNERRYVQVGTMKTVLAASLHFDAPGDCPLFPAALVFFNVLRCGSERASS